MYSEKVEKIELDESNIRRRVLITVIALVVAGMSIAYGISSITKANRGWNVIQVNSSSQITSGSEFTFSYYLGKNGSPTAERKGLTLLYTRLCEEAYRIFDVYNEYPGENNMYYLNEHPNETVEVSETLYNAFELLQQHGNRNIYLGTIYELYAGVLYADSDASAECFDPLYSEEYAKLYQEVLNYVNNAESVDLELLGNNKVTLKVSDEYISYCKENGLTHYIDFSWMRNAFVADYLADGLIANGYTRGRLSSHDGYSRVLSGFENEYYIFDYVDGKIFQVGNLNHEAANAYVLLKSFPLSELDYDYHIYSDGSIRTAHLNSEDGLCMEKDIRSYVAYSSQYGCAETLLSVIPSYFSDPASGTGKSGIWYVYIHDNVVTYSNPADDTMQVYQTYQKTRANN